MSLNSLSLISSHRNADLVKTMIYGSKPTGGVVRYTMFSFYNTIVLDAWSSNNAERLGNAISVLNANVFSGTRPDGSANIYSMYFPTNQVYGITAGDFVACANLNIVSNTVFSLTFWIYKQADTSGGDCKVFEFGGNDVIFLFQSGGAAKHFSIGYSSSFF